MKQKHGNDNGASAPHQLDGGTTYKMGESPITPDKITCLQRLFDQKFVELRGSPLMSAEEYDKFKEWSVSSGFFEYQLSLHPDNEKLQ